MPALPYLHGYPPQVLAHASELLAQGRLAASVLQRHPEMHDVRTDGALYDYVSELKARHLRSSPPLSKAVYTPQLHIVGQALGTHTQVSRVQGGRLKAKREIRIAAVFKQAPADFLRMIVVHELAHLKQREHDRAFYGLCQHMLSDYHAIELDLRLWLTALQAEPRDAV